DLTNKQKCNPEDFKTSRRHRPERCENITNSQCGLRESREKIQNKETSKIRTANRKVIIARE
ncbi:MAG: hypothetical protein PHC42_01230, partial [Bacilli bacterium]|nr:hypothetical protein [Bacilli bacterium]